jgi:hypothetical protein
MKNILRLLLLVVLLSSCISTQKLFDKGEYDKAFYAAVGDLKKNPADAGAAKILPDAYKEAAAKYEQEITIAKSRNDKKPDKLDQIYNGYQSLQKMYDAVASSGVQVNAFQPKDYSAELDQAAATAAAARYNRGIALLQRNDRMSARKAYDNWLLITMLIPYLKTSR